MSTPNSRLLALTAIALVSAWGCADRGNDSSLAAPVGLSVERGSPPTCFSDPLAECLHTKEPIDNAKRFASHWLYPFHADLHHRVCRGDAPARERFLDGVRTLQPREGPDRVRAVYLDFLAGCSAEGFCEWAAAVATDAEEGRETRLLLLEAVRRGRRGVIAEDRFRGLGRNLDRPLGDQPPWWTNSAENRCAALERAASPWDDLAADTSPAASISRSGSKSIGATR